MECYCYLPNVQDLLTDEKKTLADINKRSFNTSSIWQESFIRNISWVRIDRGENLERRHSDYWYRRIGEYGRIRDLSSKNQCKRSTDHINGGKNSVRMRLRIPRTHSKAETYRRERRSQWRTSRRIGRASTDRTKRWRWSPERFLVETRWLHLS